MQKTYQAKTDSCQVASFRLENYLIEFEEQWTQNFHELHQYEEGLSTGIDLRTTSVQLLHSKATLLQCRLMAMVKQQLVRYYQGIAIWTE